MKRFAGGMYCILLAWQWAWHALFPAPLGNTSFWLALVASLPLLALLPGVWSGRARPRIWAAFLVLPYFLVGVMEAWSNPAQRLPALVQAGLATAFLVAVSLPGLRRRRG